MTLSRINDSGSAITFELDDLLTGTATSGTDYTAIAANAQIIVADGASSGMFTVPVIIDIPVEPTETVIAQISNSSSAAVTIVTDTATANITNDENATVAQTIDDGDAGFAIESGTWILSSVGANGDAFNVLAGTGSSVVSWTFTGLTSGQYRVSATWCERGNAATDAPYTIYDGTTARGTVDVNQMLAPSGSPELTDLGVSWEDLGGPYNITGDTLIVRLTDDANQFVTADAIRIERIGQLPRTINLGPINRGIAVDDTATGTGYIMYSVEDVFTRFAANPPLVGNSQHLIAVRFNGGWEYNDNDGWRSFTPTTDDRLLASVDFSADTITSLQGLSGQVNGITQGFVSGDLGFFANQWNGGFNAGEFTITGTSFLV